MEKGFKNIKLVLLGLILFIIVIIFIIFMPKNEKYNYVDVSVLTTLKVKSEYYKIFKSDDDYFIYGITPNTLINDLYDEISIEFDKTIYYNNEVNKSVVARTGMYLQDNHTKYYFIVMGDINGDGLVNKYDLNSDLNKISFLAYDLNNNYEIDSTDENGMKQLVNNSLNFSRELKSGEEFDYYYYKYTNTAKIINYKSNSKTIYIPEYIDGAKVIGISSNFDSSIAAKEINLNKISNFHSRSLKNLLNLEKVLVASDNPDYYSEDGVLYNKELNTLIFYPPKLTKKFIILNNRVTKIDSYAFANNTNKLIITGNVELTSDSFTDFKGTLYLASNSNLIDYCKQNKLNFIINKAPTIESLKITSKIASKTINFTIADDILLDSYSFTKNGKSAKWIKIDQRDYYDGVISITETGNYTLAVKDIYGVISKKSITIDKIQKEEVKITSIKIISPSSGLHKTNVKVQIRANFSSKINGVVPTLTINVGNIAGKGTMSSGIINDNYIDYVYTPASSDRGLISINSYSGGKLTDDDGFDVIVNKLSNSGNQVTLYGESGILVNGVYLDNPIKNDFCLAARYNTLENGKRHGAIDLHGKFGTPIMAVCNGAVIYTDGTHVRLDCRNGVIVSYSLLSQVNVATGQNVNQGDIVGLMGDQGGDKNYHLHFIVVENGGVIDPQKYFYQNMKSNC
jgi:hypothetical protein